MSRARIIIFVAAVVGLLATAGVPYLMQDKPKPTVTPRPNVVLIVIDTLRASHLSCYGYERNTSPFLDSLARQSVQYEHAVSTAPWTAPAMASLFSSFYPTAHGVTDHVQANETQLRSTVLSEQFTTLAEVLKANGYQTVGFTANAWVADYLGFAQGFDTFVTRDYAKAGQVNREFFEMVRGLDRDETTPLLLYLHYMDPHLPYDPPPAQVYKGSVDEYEYASEHLANLNKYDGEIRYVDARIRELFDFLGKEGVLDNAVVVVTSDHGEQFGEYGRRSHGHTVHNVEVHVPLLIRADGLEPAKIATTVSLVDVYPTLLEILGIPLEHPVQGVSLIGDLDRRKATSVVSESTRTGDFRALTNPDGMKVVRDFVIDPLDAGQDVHAGWGLYDSRADYWAEDSLTDPDLLHGLAAEYYSIHAESLRYRQGIEVTLTDLDEKTLRQLRALGYTK